MREILTQYKEVMLDLLFTATLLGILATVSTMAFQQVATREVKVEIQDSIKEYRELSIYDKKEMTGNDIVIALKKYADKYSIYISLPNGDYAFRRVCVEEPDLDISEHIHKNKNTICTTVWIFDDLCVSNRLSGDSHNGYKVTAGGVGGSKIEDRTAIYDNKFVNDTLGSYLSNKFSVSLVRWKYDETIQGLEDSYKSATTQKEKEEILELRANYERRKDDIYGLNFKCLN